MENKMKKHIAYLTLLASIIINENVFAATTNPEKDINYLMEWKISRGLGTKMPSVGANGTLDLSNKQLTSLNGIEKIEKSERDRVHTLLLKNNNLQNLAESLLGLFSNLKMLDLSNNKIKTLNYSAFSNLPSLLELNLSNNQINKIDAGAFQQLPNLTKLNLSNNQINDETIEKSGPFKELTDLEELDLSKNQISARSIENDELNDLKKLKSLNLDDTLIQTVTNDFIKKFPAIKGNISFKSSTPLTFKTQEITPKIDTLIINDVLDLSNQGLTSLNGLERIQQSQRKIVSHLKLNDNRLSTFTEGFFALFPNLQSLELQHNKISTINPYTFKALKKLQTLDLSHNNIKIINPTAFEGLTELTSLNLSNNQIQVIGTHIFDDLPKLEELDLSSNTLLHEVEAPTNVKITR